MLSFLWRKQLAGLKLNLSPLVSRCAQTDDICMSELSYFCRQEGIGGNEMQSTELPGNMGYDVFLS